MPPLRNRAESFVTDFLVFVFVSGRVVSGTAVPGASIAQAPGSQARANSVR
jgi:hypothetical protein